MKYLLPLLLLMGHLAIAQHEDVYVVEDGKKIDFTFSLDEIESFEHETNLILKHNKKRKRKKIKEYSSGSVKFTHSDSTFWIGFIKFYDEYFIALIARRKERKESEFGLFGYEYRRIFYSEIENLQSGGKRKFLWPRLLAGTTSLTAGTALALGSISANPVLVPVGVGIGTIGYLIVHPLTTKNFHFPDWSYEVENKPPPDEGSG